MSSNLSLSVFPPSPFFLQINLALGNEKSYNGTGVDMKKKDFCAVLLSRFIALDEEARYNLISSLVLAESECVDEESQEFKEWTATLMEVLFPEIGDLIVS